MLKKILKKYLSAFLYRNCYTPAVQITQRQLYLHYNERFRNRSSVQLSHTGFKVFSQFEEDGKIGRASCRERV